MADFVKLIEHVVDLGFNLSLNIAHKILHAVSASFEVLNPVDLGVEHVDLGQKYLISLVVLLLLDLQLRHLGQGVADFVIYWLR